MDIWQTPLPLPCPHGLGMSPREKLPKVSVLQQQQQGKIDSWTRTLTAGGGPLSGIILIGSKIYLG